MSANDRRYPRGDGGVGQLHDADRVRLRRLADGAGGARRASGSGVGEAATSFRRAKIVTATFYAEQILPKATALLTLVRSGTSHAQTLRDDDF